MSYLSSFSSDDIKNIEVISTPPAKYQAEGNGGLINIILKRPKENSWNNQIRTSYTQTTYPATQLGNTFNYSHQKWKIFASIDGKNGHSQKLTKMNIYYPAGVWKDTIKTKIASDYISGKLGIDYQISNKSNIGIFYSGDYKKPNSIKNSNTFIMNTHNTLIGKVKNIGGMKQKTINNILNVHYSQKLDTLGSEMFIDLDYFNYKNNKDREFKSEQSGYHSTFQKTNNTGIQNIENYSAKVDFQHPTKFANYSYGGKIARTTTNNDVNFYDLSNGIPVFSQNKSNAFKYTEDIQALYLDISKKFNENLQAKLGLRSEFTQTEGFSKNLNQVNKKNYVQLFPTLYLSYTKDINNIFNLSLNRRINRPSFARLNPFKFYINANSYVEGNPNLQPSFSNEIRFKYILKKAFITELYFNYIEDIASQIPKVDTNQKQQYYTFQNVGNLKSYGASQTILFNPFKWWNTTSMISGVYQETMTDVNLGTDKIFNGWKFQAYTNQVFLLNREGTIQAEASFYGQTRGNEFMFNIDPFWKLDLGFKMNFMDKKLQLTARINDVFKTSSPNVTTYTNGVKQIYNTYDDNRSFTLGFSYKFGNEKIRVKEKELGNKDEVKRLD
ncbi:outer membrane beta-barrel protein [Ornithobacterium rhinotracheale]|uniref:outer membrane beta-barrel protein n=1 Tax=Ornithobacterium rhinotracheale TaxID=28251 RepID=UPI001FF384D7|nr:outer membrane beta-barrel family protein [Ornithobacterium rhinotracheale]